MPAANDIAESTSAPGRNGASAPDRLESYITQPRARRGGLTVTQTLVIAASLLVGTTLLVTATRTGSTGPNPSATSGAVDTTRAPVARTAFLDAPTTVAGSTAPATVVTTAAATETTTATGATAATTAAPATAAPATTPQGSAPAPTTASTSAGAATTVISPTSTSPTVTAPAGEVPSPTLPTGQRWPEAVLGTDGRLVAQGAVPSAANRQAIVAALGLIANVTDQLTIEATAASVKYVPVRLGPAINFGPGDPDVTEAEKAVLVLWGNFLRDHSNARLLLVARGPKPLNQEQLTVATARLIAAKRELVAIGADTKQVSTDAVGDATVQNGRLDIALAIG